MEVLATSNLPGAPLGEGAAPTTLTAALRLIAAALPDSPAIVVIDEAPWLLEGIKGGAGELQRVWDKDLSQKPVLLLLLGSDLEMMQELNNPDQPFYGRGREMMLKELNPAEIANWTGLSGIRAFDAYLLTGGQPLIAEDWQPMMAPIEFIKKSLSSPLSALATEGVRVLRFWLAFMQPSLGDIDRGRADLAIARFSKGYQAWRGRAIEPIVREALKILLPDDDWPNTREIGGWWPRNNIPEIDLVGSDGRPAHNISFVGTIKWRERAGIADHDVAELAKAAVRCPVSPRSRR